MIKSKAMWAYTIMPKHISKKFEYIVKGIDERYKPLETINQFYFWLHSRMGGFLDPFIYETEWEIELHRDESKHEKCSVHIFISDEEHWIPDDPAAPSMANVIITRPNLINLTSSPFPLKADETSIEGKSNDDRRVSLIKIPTLNLQIFNNKIKIRIHSEIFKSHHDLKNGFNINLTNYIHTTIKMIHENEFFDNAPYLSSTKSAKYKEGSKIDEYNLAHGFKSMLIKKEDR